MATLLRVLNSNSILLIIVLFVLAIICLLIFAGITKLLNRGLQHINWGRGMLSVVDTPLFRLFKGNDIAVGRHLLQMGERTYGIGKVFRKITLIISLLLLIAALLFLGKFLYTKI